jgi:hypothetical protein
MLERRLSERPEAAVAGPLVTDCQVMLIQVPVERPGGCSPSSRGKPARSYPGWVKRAGPVTQAAISLAVWLLTVIFSPVILVAGEPVNRYVMRRVRKIAAAGTAAGIRHGDRPARRAVAHLPPAASLLLVVISNPLWIALTAPGRWVSDRFRRPPSMQADTAAR